MKKYTLLFVFLSMFIYSTQVIAKPYHNHPINTPPPHYYSSTSSSNYVVRTDFHRDEHTFPDCKEHSFIKETTVLYYSNGNRRTFSYYTILSADDSVLETNCTDVNHSIIDDKHYIVFKKGKYYKIMDGEGNVLSVRTYKCLSKLSQNRLLARIDKKYGVIDFNEKVIIPIKYKSLEWANGELYISNLNGYYGLVDLENNVLVNNQFDKIKPLFDTFILKKEGKYGLADINGQILLDPEHDNIKMLGEYILVKKDGKYGLLDFSGKPILALSYKKINLKRNILTAKTQKNEWITINSDI